MAEPSPAAAQFVHASDIMEMTPVKLHKNQAPMALQLRVCSASLSARIVGFRMCRGLNMFRLGFGNTRRLLSSSFLGLPYRILNMYHKKGTA